MKVFLIIFVLFFSVSSCSWRDTKRPSVLVLAVEGLDFRLVSCGSEDLGSMSGFDVLCGDSVRFTHAFTPSTLSQANIASMLTAQFPETHGVWHNGSAYLSEELETVPEVAVKNGFRTSFYSGGPPIWRKSGFSQGFELFEDNISVRLNNLYRPARDNFRFFLRWLDNEVGGAPFFSMIYISDLQFPFVKTTDNEGDLRALGLESQIKEVGEAIHFLIQGLKQRRRWFPTHIYLVGLNGKTNYLREEEIRPLNLKSENTHITLLIKPARRERDEPIQWPIDANVSLVDVGKTLYDMVSYDKERAFSSDLEVVSLSSVLERPNVTWRKDRMLLSESSWAEWRGVGPVKYSARQSNMLFLHEKPPRLYNTLTDRGERSPLQVNDPTGRVFFQNLSSYFENKNYAPWDASLAHISEKIRVAQELQNPFGLSAEARVRLHHLVRSRPWDAQTVGWLAQLFVEEGEWERLKSLGEEHFNSYWAYLADIKLGNKSSPPQDPCFDLVFNLSDTQSRPIQCEDQLIVYFSQWINEGDRSRRGRLEDRFIRAYTYYKIDERVSWLNYLNDLEWDAALDLPAGPSNLEVMLKLPRFHREQAIVNRRLQLE